MRIACVSAGRPGNVRSLQRLAGEVIWYVPEDQVGEYDLAGANWIRPVAYSGDVRHRLAWQRNAVLEDAFARDEPAVMTDDDLQRLEWTPDGEKRQPLSFEGAVSKCLGALSDYGYKLAGAAQTDNLYFYREPVGTRHLITAQLTVALPSDLRYEPTAVPKEDYDYCCQHIATFGGVCRVNGILGKWPKKNRGGLNEWRTGAEEKRAAELLLTRWPELLRPNPRREGQVLVRPRRRTA